jgi:hypothetical protein
VEGSTLAIDRLLRHIPFLRVYPALGDVRQALREARTRIKTLEADLRRTTTAVAQRELALAQAGGGSLQLLAAPAVDEERLIQLARTQAEAYRHAEPFPHLVEDAFVDPAVLARVLEEFEGMDRGGWHHSEGSHERKWSLEDVRGFGPFTAALIAQLNSGPFISFLEELTGIRGLAADPHLRGGGLHEIRPGGLLGVHVDFNVHPRLKLYRRLNLLIYLNKEWDERWGGALELWDRRGQRCVRTIPPLFNRAVLFDTSSFSYHGHPHPLACPPGQSRKSVALYYYSLECPAGDDRAAHSTIFLGRDTPA